MAAKSDVFVKMILVFFISLLSFSIGTFVGKKYSDNQHKLASLEPGAHQENSREVASAHGEGKADSSASMSDEEISKLAEEFADDHVAAAGHGEENAEGKDEHKADTHGAPAATASHDAHGEAPKAAPQAEKKQTAAAPAHGATHVAEASIPAKNLMHGKEPTDSMVKKATTESRLPSSLPKDVAQYSVGKFTVQVASFATEKEAKQRAEDMKSKGYSAFYVPANVKGKTWYRVSVGLFATEKEAKDYRLEFMSKSKTEGAIIQKIVN